MDPEVWQQLLSLESRDIVAKWFQKLHNREINARRAKEISAASRQSREFFRNAASSNNAVRPLLTFYGVASLARALTLLLRREGGEEGLTRGHGLETVDWSMTLSGELSGGLSSVIDLKIRTCAGAFSDLATETANRISMHVWSSAVDWRLNYDPPAIGDEIRLGELLARIPDLRKEHAILGTQALYARIQEMSYSTEKGLNAKVHAKSFEAFKDAYLGMGYGLAASGEWIVITGDHQLFANKPPTIYACLRRKVVWYDSGVVHPCAIPRRPSILATLRHLFCGIHPWYVGALLPDPLGFISPRRKG